MLGAAASPGLRLVVSRLRVGSPAPGFARRRGGAGLSYPPAGLARPEARQHAAGLRGPDYQEVQRRCAEAFSNQRGLRGGPLGANLGALPPRCPQTGHYFE